MVGDPLSFLERIVNWGTPVQRSADDGTTEDVFQSAISDFWTNMSGAGFSPRMGERVWAANRCIQLNSQQISSMPLRFFGTREPTWVANPDPVWYPNGIGDAVAAIVRSMYGYGDAFLYLTTSYSDGFPAGWTVLDPSVMVVEVNKGQRTYRSGQTDLDPDRVVQITRDPTAGALRGTSALSSYAAQVLGLTAAADLGNIMNQQGMPKSVLKPKRKLNAAQSAAMQEQWVTATANRRGAPAVLPPDVEFEKLSFSPADLMLLEAQEFDARAIASAFGVPAFMLNLPLEGGLTYQSPAMLGEHWWRFELSPIAGFIQRSLSSNMLPRGSYVEFDAKAAIQPTFKELVEAWAMAVEKGLVSAEEARVAIFKLPPQSPEESIMDLATPPSAGATPAQQPASVVALRPTQGVSS